MKQADRGAGGRRDGAVGGRLVRNFARGDQVIWADVWAGA